MPFFTMDLEENALNIIEAGRGHTMSVQIDLIVQATGTVRSSARGHPRRLPG